MRMKIERGGGWKEELRNPVKNQETRSGGPQRPQSGALHEMLTAQHARNLQQETGNPQETTILPTWLVRRGVDPHFYSYFLDQAAPQPRVRTANTNRRSLSRARDYSRAGRSNHDTRARSNSGGEGNLSRGSHNESGGSTRPNRLPPNASPIYLRPPPKTARTTATGVPILHPRTQMEMRERGYMYHGVSHRQTAPSLGLVPEVDDDQPEHYGGEGGGGRLDQAKHWPPRMGDNTSAPQAEMSSEAHFVRPQTYNKDAILVPRRMVRTAGGMVSGYRAPIRNLSTAPSSMGKVHHAQTCYKDRCSYSEEKNTFESTPQPLHITPQHVSNNRASSSSALRRDWLPGLVAMKQTREIVHKDERAFGVDHQAWSRPGREVRYNLFADGYGVARLNPLESRTY